MTTWRSLLSATAFCLLLFGGRMLLAYVSDETDSGIQRSASGSSADDLDDLGEPRAILSKGEARERAELLHEVIHELLLAVHKNYYREDEGLLLPATTMRGVFERLAERRKVQLRWLAVDAEAMNVEHRPHDEFERAAVTALKSGRTAYEESSSAQFQYAGAIPLTSECLKCHVPRRTSTRDRTAAIVITFPLQQAKGP